MRININYSLDKEAEQWVRAFNNKLCSMCKQEIDFRNNIRPHVTILMGEIDEKDFDEVKRIVESSKIKHNTHNVKPSGNPHFGGNYILQNLTESEALEKETKYLLKILDGKISPSKHLISKSNPAHITLGYCDKNISLNFSSIDNIVLSNLSVSMAGKHGVVIGS